MNELVEYLGAVQSNIDMLKRESSQYEDSNDEVMQGRYAVYTQRIGVLESLASYLKEQEVIRETRVSDEIGKRFRNLDKIPEELRKQLKSFSTDKLEDQIIGIIKNLDGSASIDEIMVEYYHVYTEVIDRKQLAAKMYRMVKKTIVFPVEGKKGIYSLTKTQENKTESSKIDDIEY